VRIEDKNKHPEVYTTQYNTFNTSSWFCCHLWHSVRRWGGLILQLRAPYRRL